MRFFEPVVGAVCRVEGDREVLASGLACHRVLREQRRYMAEARDAGGAVRRPWLSRKGLKHVAMGVTASVLVAHHIAAQEGADAETISSGLGECCEHAEDALRRWNVTDASDRGVSIEVLQAETRALGRARAAFTAAAEHALRHGLARSDALRLPLEAMRRAAWPAGERCDAESHDELCARIAAGLPLATTHAVANARLCLRAALGHPGRSLAGGRQRRVRGRHGRRRVERGVVSPQRLFRLVARVVMRRLRHGAVRARRFADSGDVLRRTH